MNAKLIAHTVRIFTVNVLHIYFTSLIHKKNMCMKS